MWAENTSPSLPLPALHGVTDPDCVTLEIKGSLSRKTGPLWQVHRMLFLRLLLKFLCAWEALQNLPDGGEAKWWRVPRAVICVLLYGNTVFGGALFLAGENSYWYLEYRPCPYTHTRNYILYLQNSHAEMAIEHKSKWISPELTITTNQKFHKCWF